jgi:Polysaccharide lyase family 4, domain II
MLNGIGAAAARRHSFVACAGVATVGMVALLAMRPALAAYEVVTVTNGGTIDGVVTLSGTAPTEPPIKVTKNQDYCGQTIPDPAYTVDSGGGLANVIVYLKDITKGKGASPEPAALVNTKCMFSPRVQGAMVSEQVKISSEDTVLHNTHPQNAETNATIFNVALPFKGFSVTKPLPSMPMMIKVKCDAHEWMHAWIMELDHPYFATTGADGHFTIKDVPPGTYTLAVWHEAAGEKSAPVVVAAGQTVKSKITLAAK